MTALQTWWGFRSPRLGARPLGVGPHRPQGLHRLRRRRIPPRRGRIEPRALPDRARRQRRADAPRVRPPLLRSGRQLAPAGAPHLHTFTPEEGATEHVGLDHLSQVSTFIADWVADIVHYVAPLPPVRGRRHAN